MMSNLVCFCWIFRFFCVITFGHVCFWPGAFTSLDWDCQTRKLSFQGLFRLVKSDCLPHCLTTKAAQSYICLPKTSIFAEEMCSWSEKKQFDGDFGSVWSVCLFFVWLFGCLFLCFFVCIMFTYVLFLVAKGLRIHSCFFTEIEWLQYWIHILFIIQTGTLIFQSYLLANPRFLCLVWWSESFP